MRPSSNLGSDTNIKRKQRLMAEKGKSAKAGRRKKSGQNLKYIGEQRHDKSHVKRLTAHVARFPTDKAGIASLAYYRGRLGIRRAA